MADPALLAGGLVAALGATVVAAAVVSRSRAAVQTIDYVRSLDRREDAPTPTGFEHRLGEPVLPRLLRPIGRRVVSMIAGLTPGNHRDQVRQGLSHAGLSGTYRPEEVIAGEAAMALVGLVGGICVLGLRVLPATLSLVVLALLTFGGGYLPLVWLGHRAGSRRAAVLADLPDMLDLLAISVEAGIGLEGAMGVVSENFTSPLADEFSRTLKEMELGLTRKDALHNLRRRADVPELGAFVTALIQADALGMSIGRVLKVQAGEMRMRRRQWARERAAKLPVKILFPLVMCIFPAVLVVVLAPAASQIARALK